MKKKIPGENVKTSGGSFPNYPLPNLTTFTQTQFGATVP
jgi:hypothetical protein